jgi:folate-binding protein YgfZ
MPTEYFLRPTAVLDVEGPDREAFLQGQLTQDVRSLSPGEARPAAGLTPKGKLIFLARVVGLPDRIRLLVPEASRERVRSHLSKYAAFQKVTVSDRTADFVRIGVYGADAAEPLPPGALRLSGEGEFGSEVLAPAGEAAAFVEALARAGARRVSGEEAEIRRVEAGRPRFGAEADEETFPDELGIEEAISRTKGCFVGQEIVARMKTYGRVNRRLVGFRFPDGPISAGSRLKLPQEDALGKIEQGRVTSSVLSPRLGPIGLGFAFRDVQEGDRLVAAGDPPRLAVVSPPRFG